MLEAKVNSLLEMAGGLTLQEIDQALEHHQRQVDMLRLLRQITAIREESQFVGTRQEVPLAEPTVDVLATAVSKPIQQRRIIGSGGSSLTEPIPTTIPHRIKTLLADGKPRTVPEITNAIGCTPAAVYNALREWSTKGLFQKDNERRWSLCQQTSKTTEEIAGVPKSTYAPPPKHPLPSPREPVSRLAPPKPGTLAYRVLELLSDGVGRTTRQIEETLAVDQASICSVLRTWERRGYFKMVAKGQWTISKDEMEYKPTPSPGSKAYRAMKFLEDGNEKQNKEISEALGGINHNTLNHLLAAWQAKGLFEQVGRGVWRLKREPEQETETEVIIPQGFFEDDDSPSQKQDPLDADSLAVDEHVLRVRSYVQRHQPCKPALMAVDLSLDLEEVLGVLKSYGCFRMEEDGWTFRNGMVH